MIKPKNLNIPIDATKEIDAYKTFAFRGQMLGMAVAMLLGSSFEKVVNSISQNILSPFSNYFLNFTEGTWRTFIWSPTPGMNLGIGSFFGSLIDFLVISFIMYLIYAKIIKKCILHEKSTKTIECQECCSIINANCKRCPQCTSWLK